MTLYKVTTNDGPYFVTAMTATAACKIVAEKIGGYDGIWMANPATAAEAARVKDMEEAA